MMIKRSLILLIVILATAFGSTGANAQNVRVKATIDTNNVLIGDQIKLLLQCQSDKKTNIVMPQIPDSIGKLEIVRRSKIDTVDTAGNYSLKQTLIITSFDSGMHVLPPITFMFEKEGLAELYPLATDTIFLKFRTVPVDTALAIKDIKGPMDSPLTFAEILPYIIGAWVIIAIGVLIWYFWIRRKKLARRELLDYDPSIPAHIIALEALKQLDAEKLWQKGAVKQYYIRMSDIVRVYIERRFEFLALDMTSGEITTAMRGLVSNNELIEKLNKILEIADLAKFAKYQPLADENALTLTYSFSFVTDTIKHEVISNSEENKN